MQVNALVVDRHLACNLLGAPLNAKVVVHICPDLGIYTAGMASVFGSFKLLGAGLLDTAPTQAKPENKFAAD